MSTVTRAIGPLTLLIALMGPFAAAGAQAVPSGVSMGGMHGDGSMRVFALADVLEYVPNGTGGINADALAWIGGDFNRLYFRLDGTQPLKGSGGEMAFDVAYGRLASPFWTALVGTRVEVRGLGSADRSTRTLLALGFEGMSPYFLEIEPSLYVSTKGEVSGRLAAAVDLLFTQRLIVQPRLETHFAVQGVPEIGIGAGVNEVELGAQMRYEIRREAAPYVGLRWVRQTGGTAGLARSAGERVSEAGLVLGIRMWR